VSLVSSMYWLGYYSPQQPKEPLEKSVKNVVSCGAPDPRVPVRCTTGPSQSATAGSRLRLFELVPFRLVS
jgi:hypothetical protein